jgi:hypothetical protein
LNVKNKKEKKKKKERKEKKRKEKKGKEKKRGKLRPAGIRACYLWTKSPQRYH